MRLLSALILALFLIAPTIAAESSDVSPLHGCEGTADDDGDGIPNNEDPDCHDHQESPGVGAVAAIGALGALAFMARRRLA